MVLEAVRFISASENPEFKLHKHNENRVNVKCELVWTDIVQE